MELAWLGLCLMWEFFCVEVMCCCLVVAGHSEQVLVISYEEVMGLAQFHFCLQSLASPLDLLAAYP